MQARRKLLDALTEAAWTGRPDFDVLERAVTAVFDAGTTHVRRRSATLPPDNHRVADDQYQGPPRCGHRAVGRAGDRRGAHPARDAHVFAYAEYVAKHAVLAGSVPPGAPDLYAPSPWTTRLSNCCGHLLSASGMEILYPEQSERMRRSRAFMRRPSRAELGLTLS